MPKKIENRKGDQWQGDKLMKAEDKKAITSMIKALGKVETAQSKLSFTEWTKLSRYLNLEGVQMEIVQIRDALARFLFASIESAKHEEAKIK